MTSNSTNLIPCHTAQGAKASPALAALDGILLTETFKITIIRYFYTLSLIYMADFAMNLCN